MLKRMDKQLYARSSATQKGEREACETTGTLIADVLACTEIDVIWTYAYRPIWALFLKQSLDQANIP